MNFQEDEKGGLIFTAPKKQIKATSLLGLDKLAKEKRESRQRIDTPSIGTLLPDAAKDRYKQREVEKAGLSFSSSKSNSDSFKVPAKPFSSSDTISNRPNSSSRSEWNLTPSLPFKSSISGHSSRSTYGDSTPFRRGTGFTALQSVRRRETDIVVSDDQVQNSVDRDWYDQEEGGALGENHEFNQNEAFWTEKEAKFKEIHNKRETVRQKQFLRDNDIWYLIFNLGKRIEC